ncbi:hypothetical protein E3Q23_00139, partial [Wallemia mellicola]
AIVPESLKFAYVDNSSLDIYNEKKFSSRYNRSHDMDVYGTQPTSSDDTESTKQVLILEFTDVRSIYSRNAIKQDVQLSRAPTLSRSDTLKLIERRNDRFKVAVNELLQATKETGDDPVQLVISAAHHHLPSKPLLNPSVKDSLAQKSLPTQRPSIEQVLEEFRYQDWYKDQSIFHKTIPARQALYSDWDLVIPEPIRRGLRSTLYVESLFAHQAQAIQSLNEGNNVIVSTSTASGKSLIYTLPFLMSFYQDRESTAFFIFPTKALAQDQNTKLKDLLKSIEGMENVIVDTFDGDTPTDRRDDLRDNASLLFTNFDTLHHTILPKEDKWRRYLANLRFVVVDELHYYSGVQGTHVAFVMRRLRRLCAALGNVNIKFISTSATIGNPVRHFQTLFGVEKVTLVDVDGAPSGQKEFLIWKPALIDELMPNGPRNNPMHEVSQLMRYLISRGVRTIAFCAVATNALELGIDVGALDAVLCLGFPYSLSSLRQQMGRAGRARRDSLAILIAESLPLDNYYSNYPEEIFTRPPTDLQVDIDNDAIFEPHLQCASDELPVSLVGDRVYFGKDQLERVAARSLDRDDQGWYHCDPRLRPYPSRFIKLRGNEESIYKVYNVYKNSESLIEQVEESRAVFELYEGGIFFNAGLSYQIYEVSHDTKICRANQVNVNFNTKPRDYTDVDPIETCRMRAIKGSTMRAFYGRIKVSTYVFGYLKLRDFKVLDIVDLDTPPYVRLTNGFWLDVPANAMHIMNIKSINPAEAIQAAQHALMSLTPLYTMSAEGDIQTDEKKSVKEYQQKESKRKRPGSCVQGEVKDGQASTSKLGAIVVLSSLIGKQLSMDDIPDQAPFVQSQSVIYPETIVQADTLSSVELEE